MPELLHPHVIVRTQVLYNVSMNRSQTIYVCASQKLGCGWGRVIQVVGDVLLDPLAQAELTKAEVALAPKATEGKLD